MPPKPFEVLTHASPTSRWPDGACQLTHTHFCSYLQLDPGMARTPDLVRGSVPADHALRPISSSHAPLRSHPGGYLQPVCWGQRSCRAWPYP